MRKVCYFDLGRRARYLPGADGKDPALDIEYAADLETLPELVERYVEGEEAGRHDAFVLNSFAIWFSYVFSKVLKEKRVRTGRLELVDPDEFRDRRTKRIPKPQRRPEIARPGAARRAYGACRQS